MRERERERGDGVGRGEEKRGFSGLETRLALFRNDVAAFPRREQRDSATWRTRSEGMKKAGGRKEEKKGVRRYDAYTPPRGIHSDTRHAKYMRDSQNFRAWKLTNG